MSSQQLLAHSPSLCVKSFPRAWLCLQRGVGVLCHCCLALGSRRGPSLQRHTSHSPTLILASAVRKPQPSLPGVPSLPSGHRSFMGTHILQSCHPSQQRNSFSAPTLSLWDQAGRRAEWRSCTGLAGPIPARRRRYTQG